MKVRLTELRADLLPLALDWARAGQASRLFLELLIADIRKIENKSRLRVSQWLARSSLFLSKCLFQIESFSLSLCCSAVAAAGRVPVTAAQSAASEQQLMDMLTLRSQLVECLLTTTEGEEREMTKTQEQYISLHKELDTLRDTATTTSDRKVLIHSSDCCKDNY